ncbi:hypothetical protein BDV39DRAFT_187934 [Aspergillus sergii]|uniref:ER transporter 6TM N-terminal domain-containing protein n=1 Tax=Aspergillus sergii TaxID=1034303 RepID=A0A5N6WIC1_9EURO|nr:hypothetical protein BDV39DRAFT_187934 [Aspergillus sergii]
MTEQNTPQVDTELLLSATTRHHAEALSQHQKRLPQFLDHFNARELRIFFRCWVAAWVSSLFIFIPSTLNNLGVVAFFACLIQLILPPNGVVLLQILGALSLFLGIAMGWAWGVISSKAARAIRPAALTQARAASLQQAAVELAQADGISVQDAAKHVIFSGHMLDARVTVINYCMICVFIYLMARLRASNPKTALTAIFAIVIADIFLMYTPLLPSFTGTLPLGLVKSAAIGVGIGVACSILFFPQSTSYIVLNSMCDVINLLKSPLAFTALALENPGGKLSIDRLKETEKKIIKEYQAMEPALKFLPLDFSVGYWGAKDVQSLKEPLSQLLTATMALLEFHLSRTRGQTRGEEILDRHMEDLKEKDIDEKKGVEDVHLGSHQMLQTAELLAIFRNSGEQRLRPDTIRELVGINDHSIEACLTGLSIISECIQMVNCRRWFNCPSRVEREELIQRCQTTLETLRQAHVSLINDTYCALTRDYQMTGNIRSSSEDALKYHIGGPMLVMVSQEHIANTIGRTEAFLTQVLKLLTPASKVRFWCPLSIGYAASWVVQSDMKAPGANAAEFEDPEKPATLSNKAQQQLRDALGRRPKRKSRIAQTVLTSYHWLTSSEGLYGLRMVVITIALSVPQVIPHSAKFWYEQKCFWGLVMGQTGLVIYMADFAFSVISRAVATVLGGVLGLLAWYIGSGKGDGNPYGLSAVMAVMLIFFLWLRLYLPSNILQGAIISAATFLIIVAYSYADTHVPSYGNPGFGYTLFWRRLLLVLAGTSAAAIMQLLPHPPSATRHLCKALSTSIHTISDHYALVLSCWNHSENNGRLLAGPFTLHLAESLLDLDEPIARLRFEFSSSNFDSKTLHDVQSLCFTMNLNLGRLLMLATSLPLKYRQLLARQTGLLNPHTIGTVMAVLATGRQSLKTGDAPPRILPTPLIRQALTSEFEPQNITDESLRDGQYRQYCVALCAYLEFLWSVDELLLVIKGAVGESHLIPQQLAESV